MQRYLTALMMLGLASIPTPAVGYELTIVAQSGLVVNGFAITGLSRSDIR
jgi:hypothetical protein